MGLMRSITETLGGLAGSALIYTLSAFFVACFKGVPDLKKFSPIYLIGCGVFFVLYEVMLSQAIGLATSHVQSIELGLINYAWPCLTILFAVIFRLQKSSLLLWGGALLSFIGLFWGIAGEHFILKGFFQHIMHNPIAYFLAIGAAVTWSLYCNVTRIYGAGQNGVFWFFSVVSVVLWTGYLLTPHSSLIFSWSSCIQLLVIGLFSALGYSFWDDGIQKGNMTLLVTASYFIPLLSTFMASWWLSTELSISFWQSVMMVTVGSLVCWYGSQEDMPEQVDAKLQSSIDSEQQHVN